MPITIPGLRVYRLNYRTHRPRVHFIIGMNYRPDIDKTLTSFANSQLVQLKTKSAIAKYVNVARPRPYVNRAPD